MPTSRDDPRSSAGRWPLQTRNPSIIRPSATRQGVFLWFYPHFCRNRLHEPCECDYTGERKVSLHRWGDRFESGSGFGQGFESSAFRRKVGESA